MINFGMLDWQVQVFLEATLPPEGFLKIKALPFHDRVEIVKRHMGRPDASPEKREGFDKFLRRLEPVRELRNHIAHGVLRFGLAADQKTPVMTLSLPRDLDVSNLPGTRHVDFAELQATLSTLNELLEEFGRLAGFNTTWSVTIPADTKA